VLDKDGDGLEWHEVLCACCVCLPKCRGMRRWADSQTRGFLRALECLRWALRWMLREYPDDFRTSVHLT
jgi:hypothetical protein